MQDDLARDDALAPKSLFESRDWKLVFERARTDPLRLPDLPCNHAKIGFVIGHNPDPASRLQGAGEILEKIAGHDPARPVPPFWPGIGEKKVKKSDRPGRQQIAHDLGAFELQNPGMGNPVPVEAALGGGKAPRHAFHAQEITARFLQRAGDKKSAIAAAEIHLQRGVPAEKRNRIDRFHVRLQEEARHSLTNRTRKSFQQPLPSGGLISIMKKFFAALLLAALAVISVEAQTETKKTAIFGGGCFWCMQPPYDSAKGVLSTRVGYSGGAAGDANYGEVSGHKTKHREVIEVTYDPAQISYADLVEIFWRNINPTQADGQFADIGLSYQAAIYFASPEEKQIAEESKKKLSDSGRFDKPVVTEILAAQPFYPAEEYHQKYYQKNPAHYKAYAVGSGRAGFIAKHWKN